MTKKTAQIPLWPLLGLIFCSASQYMNCGFIPSALCGFCGFCGRQRKCHHLTLTAALRTSSSLSAMFTVSREERNRGQRISEITQDKYCTQVLYANELNPLMNQPAAIGHYKLMLCIQTPFKPAKMYFKCKWRSWRFKLCWIYWAGIWGNVYKVMN